MRTGGAFQHRDLKYNPISKSSREIRLATIHCGKNRDQLKVSIQHASLDNWGLYYHTLSYVWGDSLNTASIIVHGHEVMVSENLRDAFLRIRMPRKDVVVWADALCINQYDLAEKRHQVGLMAEIYNRSHSNFIWLGICKDPNAVPRAKAPVKPWISWQSQYNIHSSLNPTANQEKFKKWLRDLPKDECLFCSLSRPHHRCLTRNDDPQEDVQPLHDFAKLIRGKHLHADLDLQVFGMNRSLWWTRAWTFQEVVLPSKSFVLYDRWTMDWDDLAAGATTVLDLHGHCCRNAFHEREDLIDLLRKVKSIDDGRKYYNTKGSKGLLDIPRALHGRFASDPRDKIYALLGLMPSRFAEKLPPDYTLEPAQVFHRAFRVVAESLVDPWQAFINSQFNGFSTTKRAPWRQQRIEGQIAMRSKSQVTMDLPSWVPDFGQELDTVQALKDHDRASTYHAYDAHKLIRSSSSKISIPDSSLLSFEVRGYSISRIGSVYRLPKWNVNTTNHQKTIAEALVEGLPSYIRSTLQSMCSSIEIMRILIGDMFPIPRTDDNGKEWLRVSRRRTVFEMLKTATCGEAYVVAGVKTAYEMSTYGRSLFLSGHRIGICPMSTQTDDEVWVFEGSRVPFVVRPFAWVNHQRIKGAEFIGDCFLDGITEVESINDKAESYASLEPVDISLF
jgi:Heterokaryon incompatibility protein (HET)